MCHISLSRLCLIKELIIRRYIIQLKIQWVFIFVRIFTQINLAARLAPLFTSCFRWYNGYDTNKCHEGASYEGGGCASKSLSARVSNQIRVESFSVVGSTNNQLHTVDGSIGAQIGRVIFGDGVDSNLAMDLPNPKSIWSNFGRPDPLIQITQEYLSRHQRKRAVDGGPKN